MSLRMRTRFWQWLDRKTDSPKRDSYITFITVSAVLIFAIWLSLA